MIDPKHIEQVNNTAKYFNEPSIVNPDSSHSHRLFCTRMFLLQIREALKDELSDDAIELFKTLERGFEELMGGKVPAQFKQAQKIGELTIEEQKNRALLLVGSDLLWKDYGQAGSAQEGFRICGSGTILSQKTRRTRPMMSTSETKMVEKKSVQNALAEIRSRSRKQNRYAAARGYYSAVMSMMKYTQTAYDLNDQELAHHYFEDYLPLMLGKKRSSAAFIVATTGTGAVAVGKSWSAIHTGFKHDRTLATPMN